MHDGGKKAVIAALLANGGIATAKFVAFGFTGAASMLAEAVHSVADTGNQALLLLGGAKAKKAPTEQHPFGYGRERYFWAFVVSIILFSLGSLFALHEGIEKLRHPHELSSLNWAFGVLIFAIIVESLSFRTAIIESKKVKGKQGWWSFIRRTKNPELSTVLLEDAGALIGLVFALTGITLAQVTDEPRFDAMGSIAIGLLLGFIAIVLAKENKSLLIGESADEEKLVVIKEAIESSPHVKRIIHIRTLHLGPEELLIASKIEFELGLDQATLSASIDEVERQIRAATPEARLIFIEPDLYIEKEVTAQA